MELSSHHYGVTWKNAATPVIRTFQAAIPVETAHSYLMVFKDANHFSSADPVDGTTGRPFWDFPASQPENDRVHPSFVGPPCGKQATP